MINKRKRRIPKWYEPEDVISKMLLDAIKDNTEKPSEDKALFPPSSIDLIMGDYGQLFELLMKTAQIGVTVNESRHNISIEITNGEDLKHIAEASHAHITYKYSMTTDRGRLRSILEVLGMMDIMMDIFIHYSKIRFRVGQFMNLATDRETEQKLNSEVNDEWNTFIQYIFDDTTRRSKFRGIAGYSILRFPFRCMTQGAGERDVITRMFTHEMNDYPIW